MTSHPTRARLSLLAVSSLATAGGALAAAPAHATTATVPGPVVTDTLTAPGATADALGNLTVTAASLPYTVTIAYTAKPMASSPPTTVTSVNVLCGPSAGTATPQVVSPFDPATGKGKETCTYTQPGVEQILITANDSMSNTTSVSEKVSINQPAPPPPASNAPTVGLTLTAGPGGGPHGAGTGNVIQQLPHAGGARVRYDYTAKAVNFSGVGIASATLDCGVPGTPPIQETVGSPTSQYGVGTNGWGECGYTQPGTYTVTISATDNQSPAKTTAVSHTVTVTPETTIPVDRYDGTSRYGTGVALSRAAFPTAGSAGAVVLARGDVFADALAGIPLAKAKNGPLLLTPGGGGLTAVDPNVEAEILRVLPKDKSHTVYILGGTGAISQAVEDQVSSLGYTVVRLAGASRFDTALAIAQDPRALNNPGNVVVARGDDFADALAAGPYAANIAKDGAGTPAAVVLSNGPATTGKLDASTAAYVASKISNPAATVTAIGGGAQTAVNALPGGAVKATSIVGTDRYATAYFVARTGWGSPIGSPISELHSAIQGLATGSGFADALTGGAYMALKNGPLILVNSANFTFPTATIGPLSIGVNSLTDVAVFGGSGVLPTSVSQAALFTVNAPASAYVDHHVLF